MGLRKSSHSTVFTGCMENSRRFELIKMNEVKFKPE